MVGGAGPASRLQKIRTACRPPCIEEGTEGEEREGRASVERSEAGGCGAADAPRSS